MTAPLSVSRPAASGDGPFTAESASPAARVVSVSPRAAASSPPATRGRNPMFITPRVIDQQAFNEWAQALRSLTEGAQDAGRDLAEQIALALGAETGAKKAAEDLQERLRLGARMLSAFQSQIARIEAAIAEFDRRKQAARGPRDGHVDQIAQALRSVAERIECAGDHPHGHSIGTAELSAGAD